MVHRGCIIYFHLHSQLGNNSRIKTCNVYRLPLSTIGTGFEKKCNISIWLPIVKSLSFNSVVKYIPISPSSNSSFQSYGENITKTKGLVCCLKKYDIKILIQTNICFGATTNTHQYIRSNCKGRNDKSLLKQQTIRHNQRVIGRPNKHLELNNYIFKIVNNRWKIRILIPIDIL